MLGWLALAAVCTALPDGSKQNCDAPRPVHEEASAPSTSDHAAIGAQWLWAIDKAMPGVLLAGSHRMVRFDLETSLIALTGPASEPGPQFLGSQFGFHVMIRPLYGRRGELAGGLGADGYSLWNVHGDLFEAALAVRVAGHFWISKRVGAFATARAYPLATSGLELGTSRAGSPGMPILFGTGVEWRFR